MANFITCTVPNKFNEEEKLIVLTKLTDDVIRFLIVRSDRTLMVGELALDDFKTYAEHFKKSLNEYLEETKDILSGKRQDIDFSLKDDKFYWKRKTWLLGQVAVELATNETDFLSEIIFFQSDYLSRLSKKVSEDEKVIENLKKSNDDLTYKMNELILLKEQMESEWYRAILVVINSMKAKIREQQKELNALKKPKKDAVYDLSTDESDNESNNNDSTTSQSVLVKKSVKKRFLEENDKSLSGLSEKKRRIEHKNIKQNNSFIEDKEVLNNDEHEKESTTSKTIEPSQKNKEVGQNRKLGGNEKMKEELLNNKKSDNTKNVIVNSEIHKEKLSQDILKTDNKSVDKVELKITTTTENTELSIKHPVNKTQVEGETNSSQVDTEPIASTSKTLLSSIGEDEETPDILSDESYCEMELKLEEEKDDENDKETNDKKEEKNSSNRDEENEGVSNDKTLLFEQDSEEMVF